jgi:hypothetical protein
MTNEPVQTARSADGVKTVLAPRQQFVHVSLVAHVKEQTVVGGLENVVQRNGEFHYAKVRAQMSAIAGEDGD